MELAWIRPGRGGSRGWLVGLCHPLAFRSSHGFFSRPVCVVHYCKGACERRQNSTMGPVGWFGRPRITVSHGLCSASLESGNACFGQPSSSYLSKLMLLCLMGFAVPLSIGHRVMAPTLHIC